MFNKCYRNKSKLLALTILITILIILFNESVLQKQYISYQSSYHPVIESHSLPDYKTLPLLLANQTIEQKLVCKLPKFVLEGHNNVEEYKECKQRAEWGYLKANHWNLNYTVVKPLKSLRCQYRAVSRVDDFKLKYSKLTVLVDKQVIDDDVIEVVCKGTLFGRKMMFNHVYVQIVPKINPQLKNTDQTNSKESQCLPLNIILLSYDSLSRVSWFKRLPKSTNFLINQMKFDILYGQSILGDGTPACMIPLLTGSTESELPSALKTDPNGKYVDQVYPFIWNELHPKGYMSYHMEDWPHVTTFHYRMRGMSNLTAHHYMRPYQMSVWGRVSNNYWRGKDDLCIGSVKRHKKALDVMTEFVETYKDNSKNHIAIMHYIENSHDGNARANHIDGDLVEFLKANQKKDNFKNTAIFLFSDHGARFGNERTSFQGYLEERQPFFSIYLPDEYKKSNPTKYANLLRNSKQITTAFDIYETIRDLTCLESKQTKRAISVLKDIPISRTCYDSGVSEHYCVCDQEWIDVNTNDSIGTKAAIFVVNYINQLTSPRKTFCTKLELQLVKSVKKGTMNKKFHLKLVLVTKPNNAIYEVMVRADNANDKNPKFFIDSPQFISRSNAYKDQPKCLEKAPKDTSIKVDLRKFCFCKS